MLWEGAAIDRAWPGNPVSSRYVRLILGMDHGHSRLQVFQRKVELVRIGLLGFASEGCLLGCDELLKPFDPLILTGDMLFLNDYRDFLRHLRCLCRDQNRLEGGNIINIIV